MAPWSLGKLFGNLILPLVFALRERKQRARANCKFHTLVLVFQLFLFPSFSLSLSLFLPNARKFPGQTQAPFTCSLLKFANFSPLSLTGATFGRTPGRQLGASICAGHLLLDRSLARSSRSRASGVVGGGGGRAQPATNERAPFGVHAAKVAKNNGQQKGGANVVLEQSQVELSSRSRRNRRVASI